MDSRIYRIFGSNVRRARERQQFTQEQLAQRVDLSRTSITNIEQGRQRVLLHQIVEIANALETKPEDLLVETDNPSNDLTARPDIASVVNALKAEIGAA